MRTTSPGATTVRSTRRQLRRAATLIAAMVVAAGVAGAVPSSAGASVTAPTTGATVSSSTTSTTSAGSSTSTTTATRSADQNGNATATAGAHPGALPRGGTQVDGAGSSFAAPAIEDFTSTVLQPPYSLNVNYSSTNSGDGRYEFTNQTTDFAATDIAYGLGNTDTAAPNFPFIYITITAGGIAFMYNIPGLTAPLQLTSYTACAILTGGITNWDDPTLKASGANAGVTLPNLAIRPVTESDSAGTNYVLEEWCIDTQPAIWTAFANQENHQPGGPADGVAIDTNSPNSNWPGLPNGLDQQSTSGVAGNIATTPGAIGAVQVKYATDLGFGPSSPPHGVASVLNTTGKFTQPTPVDVASALAYATQLANGTHQLNFAGIGPNVYNPSTYSYMLVKTTGSDPAKGAVLSGFVNYALTLGQAASPSFGYASLGLSLEQYGINAVLADVPGAQEVTAAEAKGYACGDLTPGEVAAGQTTPTCGVTNPTPPPPGANGGHATVAASTSAAGGSGATGSGATGSSGSGSGGSGSGGASSVDPGVSLSGTPLAFTGGNPLPLVLFGALLFVGAWFARRRLSRNRPSGGVE